MTGPGHEPHDTVHGERFKTVRMKQNVSPSTRSPRALKFPRALLPEREDHTSGRCRSLRSPFLRSAALTRLSTFSCLRRRQELAPFVAEALALFLLYFLSAKRRRLEYDLCPITYLNEMNAHYKLVV